MRTSAGRWKQRGATLTGYALIMSAMVAVSLGAVKGLEEGSTEVLGATGDSIGEARPTRDELAASITEEDPDGDSIDDPDTEPTPTYNWQSEYTGIIQTGAGFCLSDVAGELKTADCTTGASSSLEFFENLDDDNDQVQLRVNGLCVTRIGENAPVALAACQDGNDNQMWLQTPSGSLVNGASPVTSGSPGECLDIEGGDGSSGTRLLSYGCHAGPNQVFQFPGPYVPPVTAVTSVSASDASITAPMQLSGDGFISAPNGTGRSLDAPDSSLGTATFTFTIAEAGDYKLGGTTIAPNGGDDSFWISTSLDGFAQDFKWGVANSSSPSSDFVNDNNGGNDVVWSVPAGTTITVVVTVREDGTSLGDLTFVRQS